MNPFFVYALLDSRKENKIFYIGKGHWIRGDGFKHRYYDHLTLAHRGKNGPLYNKIRKIEGLGLEVGFIVLSQWELETDALSEERRMIASIGIMNLTNQTEGGEGPSGQTCSEETKRKLSLINTGKKLSAETKAKIGLKHKGKITPESTKQKMSLAAMGKKHTEESRRQMSLTRKGRIIPEEQRKKISLALKGRIKLPEHLKRISAGINLYWQNVKPEDRGYRYWCKRRLVQARENLLTVLRQIAA